MLRELTNQLAKIKNEGSFVRNISISSSWNVVGIIIQFLLSPIITRLYSPSEYGVFAIYNSIILNVSMINSFRYSETIILTTGEKQRNNAVALSFIVVLAVTLLATLVITLFHRQLTVFVGHENDWFSVWMYLMPVSIFFAGVIEILQYINVKRNEFFINGLAGFFVNITSRFYTILYANFLPPKAKGLIGGDIIGKLAAIFCLVSTIKSAPRKAKRIYKLIDIKGMLAIARIHKHFPIYNLPSTVLASLSSHLPIYFLQFQYNSSIVGAYALSSSLLEIVNRLIPYSISTAFLSKAIELKRESLATLANGAYRLFGYMIFAAFLIFGTLSLLSLIIFPLVFGSKWQMAGSIASILALSYAINFVSISLTEVFKVIGKQKLFLTTTVISVALKLGAITAAIFLGLNETAALWLFSAGGALGSFVQIFTVFYLLKFKIIKTSLLLAALMAVMIIIIYFVNFL